MSKPNDIHGDLKKSAALVELFKVSQEQRDQQWVMSFLDVVADADFGSVEPQVMQGPDGLPYFVLNSNEGDTPLGFAIKNLVPNHLLRAGIGITINPTKEQPDWVFTYGDLVNYFLRGEFYTQSDNWIRNEEELLTEDDEVLVGQPSEYILPSATRDILRIFFEGQGVKSPKVVLINRPKGEEFLQQLIFNLTPKDFQNEEHFGHTMNWLAWFLPRHYSYGSVEEQVFGEHFMPL